MYLVVSGSALIFVVVFFFRIKGPFSVKGMLSLSVLVPGCQWLCPLSFSFLVISSMLLMMNLSVCSQCGQGLRKQLRGNRQVSYKRRRRVDHRYG